jgi:hypothetical protein
LTSRDHGQQFGLPAPVDAYADVFSLLEGRRAVEVRLDEASADLTVELEGGQQLEILTDSSCYEPWNFHPPGVWCVSPCESILDDKQRAECFRIEERRKPMATNLHTRCGPASNFTLQRPAGSRCSPPAAERGVR